MSTNTTCPTRVYSSGMWGGHVCGLTAKHEHEGVMYCKRHHPPTYKAKRQAQSDKWAEQTRREVEAGKQAAAKAAEQKRRAECFPDLLEALQLILPMAKGYAHQHNVGSNQAYCDQAESVIAKATQ